jgi:hypothetical protein
MPPLREREPNQPMLVARSLSNSSIGSSNFSVPVVDKKPRSPRAKSPKGVKSPKSKKTTTPKVSKVPDSTSFKTGSTELVTTPEKKKKSFQESKAEKRVISGDVTPKQAYENKLQKDKEKKGKTNNKSLQSTEGKKAETSLETSFEDGLVNGAGVSGEGTLSTASGSPRAGVGFEIPDDNEEAAAAEEEEEDVEAVKLTNEELVAEAGLFFPDASLKMAWDFFISFIILYSVITLSYQVS